MQCSVCGKQKPLIYTNIYLKNGCCADCYQQARLIYRWGEYVFDKAYKRKGNLYRALYMKVSDIMDTFV